MPQASTNEIKPGMKLEIDNEPYLVVSNQFVKPGKGQAFNRIRVKNILSGKVVEKTFKSGDKIDLADVQEAKLRLLYTEQDEAIFMDDNTFEQSHVPLSSVGESRNFLKEDTLYEVIFYKGQIIDVIPPTFLELKVTETEPGAKGDTASGKVLKPATVETGAKIQIPIFVNEGEIIKVDTRTGEYVSRVQ
jgi:elongation factor P